MNYQKIYNFIIERAKNRQLSVYTENHHIVPKSLGGSDDSSNIVALTGKEHFLCHLLLVKIHKNNATALYKMLTAFRMMLFCISDNQNRFVSSRRYSELREKFSKLQSLNQRGSSNSQHETKWIYSDELKISKKIHKDDSIPEGWIKGRKLNFDAKKCVKCDSVISTKGGLYCEKHLSVARVNNGIKNSIHIIGKGASSYNGKKFITNGKIDKLHLIDASLPEGWIWGRSNNKKKSKS